MIPYALLSRSVSSLSKCSAIDFHRKCWIGYLWMFCILNLCCMPKTSWETQNISRGSLRFWSAWGKIVTKIVLWYKTIRYLYITYESKQFFSIMRQFCLFGRFFRWLIRRDIACNSFVGNHFIFLALWICEIIYECRRRCSWLLDVVGWPSCSLVNCYLRRIIFELARRHIVEVDWFDCVI